MPAGMTLLDFVRYRQNLKGTKIGCREGDCGACTILVGELLEGRVRYRTMTSCLMPLANAAGKHIVTIEGLNREGGSLTPVQQAVVDESGTQCGFCTVGFVMSLTGFLIGDDDKTPQSAVSSIDGNICRCTGYKSLERAAKRICMQPSDGAGAGASPENTTPAADDHPLISRHIIPEYFADIAERLAGLEQPLPHFQDGAKMAFVGGGTDVYVQRPEEAAETPAEHLLYQPHLRGIKEEDGFIEIGASATVTDLLESPLMNEFSPNLYKHLKLVSSTPIRNMATLAGNFANASPIGDLTVWFLALDAEIRLRNPKGGERLIPLRELYLGYKMLAKSQDEMITAVRFKKFAGDFRFNFEKVCKRTYLDIASVNTALSLRLYESGPPVPGILRGEVENPPPIIETAFAAAGGVAPIPLFLRETSAFLCGREVNRETLNKANEIMQAEISPISDVRGSREYKRLLLRQLFTAHFVEIFGSDAVR